MPARSNSVYKTAKHLDNRFLKIRCTLLGFKLAYLGLSHKLCSLKMFVKLVFVTQLKPEQKRKTKQKQQHFYILVSLFGITLTSDSYSQLCQ